MGEGAWGEIGICYARKVVSALEHIEGPALDGYDILGPPAHGGRAHRWRFLRLNDFFFHLFPSRYPADRSKFPPSPEDFADSCSARDYH